MGAASLALLLSVVINIQDELARQYPNLNLTVAPKPQRSTTNKRQTYITLPRYMVTSQPLATVETSLRYVTAGSGSLQPKCDSSVADPEVPLAATMSHPGFRVQLGQAESMLNHPNPTRLLAC